MNIKITVDSSCDLPNGYAQQNDVSVFKFPIIFGTEENIDATNQIIFDFFNATGNLAKTSAGNINDFEGFFGKYSEHYDHIIHLSISSQASASYANALSASSKYGNVHVIDTKLLSVGVGLLLMTIKDDIARGNSIEEILSNIDSRIPKVNLSFIVDTLKYLCKNGRCSKLTMFGANLLKIKPSIVMSRDGVLEVGEKYRKKIELAVMDYADNVLKTSAPKDKKTAFIVYSSFDDLVVSELSQKVKDAGFENVYCVTATSTIACHCGENTLGIVYMYE